ncbi:MAG: ATP-dependent RNA helicase HrpA [Gammaproteobacteria bacterium]|nr:ATP-dependent RNA helicase HrpA [Gammaproteobacteria bacterium]
MLEVLQSHRVLVIAGETGSGKTTQLPKLALAAGLGARGRIGHTQPRRIAARNVATRIAEETGRPTGEIVGFQTRFEKALGEDPLVKVMTDGILLAETRHDPDLRAYDCLIIDEAHERSLNIDFLIGYLKRLLQRRDDLNVIITSATIDVERFSEHFGGREHCPVIEVSGRTFPVSVRYLPPEEVADGEGDGGIAAGALVALERIRKLERAGEGPPPHARDILVFLPGERDIRDLSRTLRERLDWPDVEVLPLYARLSGADQQRVFHPGRGRRIVLATNVAETSLTVPRIGYVIDTGMARISRYSFRSKLQRLPVEPVSQASADQRAGRCGRLAPGICFRLYGEEDFEGRDAFTDPEILRTNLAAVVLQMAELGLGEPEDFPFLQPPDARALSDGRRLLMELGALDSESALTRTGRDLAGMPLDPRLARMVPAGRDRDCLAEVLVIVSALASQDPRERPPDRQQAADQAHAEWVDPKSDFMAFLRLWRWVESQRSELTSSAFRRTIGKRFLSWMRLREWRALHRQLHLLCRDRGWRENPQQASPESVHRALLPGLLGLIGMKTEKRDYLGARGQHFHIFPGSALFRQQPPWVMAAEIVETSKVYARTNAAIDPAWIEPEARHLVRRTHENPHWRRRKGRVMATERVTLYGLPVVEGRLVPWDRIDPVDARRIFILDGLARGDLETRGAFLAHNLALIEEIRELEARERRRDLLVGEEAVAALYDARIPEGIQDARSFERWRRDAEREQPRLLFLERDELIRQAPDAGAEADFPGTLDLGELEAELGYAFAPGTAEDGVTLRVPRAALPQIRAEALEWLVPGLLEEKCVALVKSLPKRVRRSLAPVPDHVAAVLPKLQAAAAFRAGSLRRALAAALERQFGVEVPADAWDPSRLDDHLRMRIEVLDDAGQVIDAGRDLAALQEKHGGAARADVARSDAVSGLETGGATDWVFGEVPERLTLESGVSVFPALVDEGDSVALRVFPDARRAADAMPRGVLRLLLRVQQRNVRHLQKGLKNRDRLGLLYAPLGDPRELFDQLALVAARRAHLATTELPRDAQAFTRVLDGGRGRLAGAFEALAELTDRILEGAHGVRTGSGRVQLAGAPGHGG